MGDDENNRLLELLRNLDFMSHLNMGELEKLILKFKLVHFEEGSLVLKQGNAGGALFLVSRGRLGVFIRDFEEVERQVAELLPGEFCGEMALITGDARTADIYALENSEVFILGKKAFSQILMANDAIARRISAVVDHRLDGLHAAFVALDNEDEQKRRQRGKVT